jgi:hypothetical protein
MEGSPTEELVSAWSRRRPKVLDVSWVVIYISNSSPLADIAAIAMIEKALNSRRAHGATRQWIDLFH